MQGGVNIDVHSLSTLLLCAMRRIAVLIDQHWLLSGSFPCRHIPHVLVARVRIYTSSTIRSMRELPVTIYQVDAFRKVRIFLDYCIGI